MEILGFGFGYDFGLEGSVPPAVSFNFNTQSYNINGFPTTLAGFSGWSYSGSVSGTGATVRTADDSRGVIHTFSTDVPRITDLGFKDEAAYIELWKVLNTDSPINQWPIGSFSTRTVGVVPSRFSGAVTTKFTTTSSGGNIQRNVAISVDTLTRVFSVDVTKQVANYAVSTGVSGGTVVSNICSFDGVTGHINSGSGTVVSKDANWWRVSVPVTNNGSAGNTTLSCVVTLTGASGQSAEVALPNVGVATGEMSYLPPGTAVVTRTADAATLTYSPDGSSAAVLYGTNSSASVSPTSPLNLGASSGGAWVNNFVRSLVITK